MAETAAKKPEQPLDDLMMAMDVVDTLRHRQTIVDRELSEDEREEDMISRLREIYTNQGIEVSDRVLQEGVAALKEERFLYKPPRDGSQVMLARLYVRRAVWGKWAGIAVAVVLALIVGWYFAIERPRQAAIEARHIALTRTLPAEFKAISARIAKSNDSDAIEMSEGLARQGLAAAAAGKLADANRSLVDIKALETRLNEAYTIQIVSEPGQKSGFRLQPKVNQAARVYYLVVQALDPSGKVIERSIRNEITGKTETVRKWGQHVPRETYDRVGRDKRDDGIVQMNKLGEKVAGKLKPEWTMPVEEGAVTRW